MHQVRVAAAELRRALAELEPGAFSAGAAAALAEELAVTENACGAAKVRMARRAAECGAHRGRGFADASDWMASATGSTMREARRQIEAAVAVEQCPETHDALVKGEVSLAQAGEIARTEGEVPGCEHELLAVARGGSLGAVRDLARKRRVEAIDREELYASQRRARGFSHWRDDLGMVRGSFALTPEIGVALVNRIDAETDRLWRQRKQAKQDGPREPRAALAADAFAAVIAGKATARTGAPVVNVVIDWPALTRGHLHDGERSHLVGGGPIPPRIVAEMLRNAFVKAVLTDGLEVQRVKHFGRRIRAELRTALELGPPPEFAGVTCDEVGCDRRYGLEWDHVDPVAHGGVTSYENLKAECGPHHWDKTERDRRAGLLRRQEDGRGPPGPG
ncbi:MAG: DUF222 domain-containing protein [Candidatus Eisenbacteria bacterium]